MGFKHAKRLREERGLKRLKNTEGLLSLVLVLSLVTGLLPGLGQVAVSQNETRLYVKPPLERAAVGETFAVQINVADVVDLYSFAFDLAYNPNVLKIQSITEGEFLKRGGGNTFFSSGEPNEAQGKQNNIVSTRFSPTNTGESGNGTLADVTFQVIGSGESGINMSGVQLFNSIVEEIIPVVEDGLFDNVPPDSATDFEASDGEDAQAALTWTNPSNADLQEVLVIRNIVGYPGSHADGDIAYQNTTPTPSGSENQEDKPLQNGETYYYAVFFKDKAGNWNDTVDSTPPDVNADTGTPQAVSPPFNNSPVANPDGPYLGVEGEPVSFDGSSSFDPDEDPLTYLWDFGDGQTSNDKNPSHTYLQDGNYTLTLVVNDGKGDSDPIQTTASILDKDPQAAFIANPLSGSAPLTVDFTDQSSSYDGITSFQWDFDNDGTVDSTDKNPSHTYNSPGTYTASLTVFEADGDQSTETKTDYITVTEEAELSPPNLQIIKYKWGKRYPGYSFCKRHIFEAWFKVRMKNTGPENVYNVKATILSAPENVTILDGEVYFGIIKKGKSVWSKDTFRIKVDTSKLVDPNEGLFWKIVYDDAAGNHHVIEDVPQALLKLGRLHIFKKKDT